MPMLPPDSIIGESPMVVEVVNRAIVLGVPLPPTCARPVETKNEPSTSDPRMLRFMMRLRFRSDLRYVGVHVAHLGRLVRGASKGALRFATFTLTDRKSTRLNSSHSQISYAVFCLKKKKTNRQHNT